jgi:hypothetical protein
MYAVLAHQRKTRLVNDEDARVMRKSAVVVA